MSQWQPIKTAPLNPAGIANGPWVLIFSKYDNGTYQARWVARGDGGDWTVQGKFVEPHRLQRHHITHWQPLPPPPS